MKTSLSIFVSGSKSLKEHRVRLKALVNNMNGENRLRGYPITLNMFSYVNLGDSQAEYDDFIQSKSDIVLFIIEDKLGVKTREEFELASQCYQKRRRPKIMVFMREFRERTPDIQEIENLISSYADSYYIDYANLEDLENKVKERLNQVVEEQMDKINASPRKRLLKLKVWAWAASVGMFLLGLFGLQQFLSRIDDVTLLFVGGGSAVSCLEELHPEVGNVYDYPNSICLAVPTSTSWPIITSEVIHHHAIKSEQFPKPFYPICLSAMAADEASFLKMSNKAQFVAKGSVLALHLGEDYLVTYVKKTLKNRFIDGKDSINVVDLAHFLQDVSKQNIRIFTTEEGSGTLTTYQRVLGPNHITLSKSALGERVDKFTDLTPKSKIRMDESPYIMLGSRYYVAKEVYKEGDCRAICVLDENGNAITKSIILYFAGYNVDGGSSLWIPDEMVDFLRKVDPRYGSVIKDNRIPRVNEQVIVDMNEYLN